MLACIRIPERWTLQQHSLDIFREPLPCLQCKPYCGLVWWLMTVAFSFLCLSVLITFYICNLEHVLKCKSKGFQCISCIKQKKANLHTSCPESSLRLSRIWYHSTNCSVLYFVQCPHDMIWFYANQMGELFFQFNQ